MNEKDLEKSSNIKKFKLVSSSQFIKSNKFPLFITLGYFLVISYVTFFHHHYLFNHDGIFYLRAGEQILQGHGWNVNLPNASIGGPIIYALLDSFFNDGFYTLKIISLLSGTGIVLVSYYITKNIFNFRIATVGQLFCAFSPSLQSRSILSTNELLPLLLIFISLYFITKRQPTFYHMIIVGFLLGIAATFRFQAMVVFIVVLVFLLIRSKEIRSNLLHITLTVIFFLIAFSPVIIYNYYVHGTIMGTDSNFYSLDWRYQTPEWRDKMENSIITESSSQAIFLDFNLFLKNYFYNLYYHNANKLFNFIGFNAISIIPPVPYLGIIPVLGGLIYSLKMSLNKINVYVFFVTVITTAFFVLWLGDIYIHFFAIIITPFLVIGILNIRNVEKNFLPLLILPVVYFLMISIVPLDRADHLLPMWISVTTLSAIFFTEAIPKISLRKISYEKPSSSSRAKIITFLLIVLVLIANLGFSYKMMQIYLYRDTYDGIKNEFSKLFEKRELEESGIEYKLVGEMLSKQIGIENSYVMSYNNAYSYYANSKSLYVTFEEGPKNDTLDNYITRKNWTPWEIYYSNIISYPIDRHDTYKPVPDYLIYDTLVPEKENLVKVISNPDSPEIPSDWKVLYRSNKTGTVVYKINHENEK